MELQIVNNAGLKAHTGKIIGFIIFLYYLFYITTKSFEVLFYFSVFNLFVVLLIVRSYRKNNITGTFVNNEFVIHHYQKIIEIPISEVWDIRYEISNYFGENWKLALVYTLYLKKVYSFGDEIRLKFEFTNEVLENKPEIIRIVEKEVEKGKKFRN